MVISILGVLLLGFLSY